MEEYTDETFWIYGSDVTIECKCAYRVSEIANRCMAHTHDCQCLIIKNYIPSKPLNQAEIDGLFSRVCKAAAPHPCICRHHRTEIADKCMANTHDCMCSIINNISATTNAYRNNALLMRTCRSTQNHVCLCAHSMQSVANMCRVHCRRHVLVLIVASRRKPRTPSTPRLPPELWEFLCDEFLM
jgi:hypothetical protein